MPQLFLRENKMNDKYKKKLLRAKERYILIKEMQKYLNSEDYLEQVRKKIMREIQ